MSDRTFFKRLTEDAEQRAAVRGAFYNTLFFVLLAICCAGLFALYQMLHLFLTPILWATLIGTVLFPLKRSISTVFSGWLEKLDEQNTPLLVGVALLPIKMVSKSADFVRAPMRGPYCYHFIVTAIVVSSICNGGLVLYALKYLLRIYNFLDSVLFHISQTWVLMVILVYATGYAAWIFVQDPTELRQRKKIARTFSLPIWTVVLAQLSTFFGPLRMAVFTASAVVLAMISAGYWGSKFGDRDETPPNGQTSSDDSEEKKTESSEAKDTEGAQSKPSVELPPTSEQVEQLQEEVNAMLPTLDAISSDTYLRAIITLCVIVWISKLTAFQWVLTALLMLSGLKDGAEFFDIRQWIANWWAKAYRLRDQTAKLTNTVVPGALRKFVIILFSSDKYLNSTLKTRADFISSIFVMGLLAVGSLLFLLFTGLQLHNETVHLAKLASNVVSTNPEWLRSAMNYTEEQLGEHDIDNYVQQAYVQSRTWVAANVRSLADPKDEKRADQLEVQANLLMDTLYRMWEERSRQLPIKAGDETEVANRAGWYEQITSVSNLMSLKSELMRVIQENVDTVLSIAQSLWKVLLLNISILSTVILEIFGLLLGFGFEMLNLLIELIVFLTVMYYLLASSTDQWLPLRWIADVAPAIESQAVGGAGVDIAAAIERAISGVFVLSAKMAIFYGFYTYFVHSLFSLNVVFVPSMLAALFAVVPILPPYSVAVFGLIELYAVRAETAAAVVFAIASIAPLFVADAAFYAEVRNSHPYVTGLAVIGGLYWLGAQGAIIGPIILCTLIVMINVYAEFAKTR